MMIKNVVLRAKNFVKYNTNTCAMIFRSILKNWTENYSFKKVIEISNLYNLRFFVLKVNIINVIG